MTIHLPARVAVVRLLSLVLLLPGLAGCTPGWIVEYNRLEDVDDFDGAYAVAVKAQERETSPNNYTAAFLAGTAAMAGQRSELAEEHLAFAASVTESNPVWLQVRACEMMALSRVYSAFRGIGRPDLTTGFDSAISSFRQAAKVLGDADAAMTMAVDRATAAARSEDVERTSLERAAIRRIRDNVAALGELSQLGEELSIDGGAARRTLVQAMNSRLDAMRAAFQDICDSCAKSKEKAASDGTGSQGSPAN